MLRAPFRVRRLQKRTEAQWDMRPWLRADGGANESMSLQLGITPRFRTIQVCPKDLAGLPRAGCGAGNRHRRVDSASGRVPMLDMKRREFISLLGGAAEDRADATHRRAPARYRGRCKPLAVCSRIGLSPWPFRAGAGSR